jgi:NAD(P)-dependent dehydrogenase (short-subunit alcohol dehydrogenase family)
MRGLEGKVIVVAAGGTGASDGTSHGASIGAATSRRLAQEGARVVVGDIHEAAAERTVDLISAAGGEAVVHRFDARDEAQTKSLMDRAVAEFGALHAVHYNAMDLSAATIGVDARHDLLTLPIAVWQRTIDVGMTGFLLAARHAIPHLLESGGGAIVATVSGAVYVGEPVRLSYAAAKTGMTAIVRHIASRWGPEGIRANAVAPGAVPGDELLATMPDERRERMLALGRSRRLGRADDIASMVAFLCSDDGEWVNGQVIAVDGGNTMRP